MTMAHNLLDVVPEVILYIFSFLDLPDLASLSQVSPLFKELASDQALHNNRIRIITPSRVNHSLFGQSAEGVALRPTVGDLVHRGVMRGLNIERRWRTGTYLYSSLSVRQYEASLLLQRRRTSSVISSFLRRRTTSHLNALTSLHVSHVLPDIESSSPAVSRILLPVMRKLKWSIQRDKLAKMVREGACITAVVNASGKPDVDAFGRWLESKGKGLVKEDSERVILAICPDVKNIVRQYEALGHPN
ncbi:hypothetical protein PC9H_003318 [Pleurotus ostreatus]|uniref:F-box domain-containing protein n=1 Tax=Pleurotus ostreatus TaxID=5322 RepID=A0A8H7A5N5_PLEOS|nr:uncharacterized protein PC9H_003318 [Pleurotus ostreatus]KAF7436485.1 hypothetical protein PC9H_003318 [Pleurotus ostreatus]